MRECWDKMKRLEIRFTPVEFITVLFLVYSLGFIPMEARRNIQDKTNYQYCRENITLIVNAVEKYQREKHYYPESLGVLVKDKYIQSIPICPSAKTDTYSCGYKADGTSGKFYIYCCSNSHKSMGYEENFPLVVCNYSRQN